MTPGNRAIEQIFKAIREEDERERREPAPPKEPKPSAEDADDFVEHIPADTIPALW